MTYKTDVEAFLAQKRIAVVGVSRQAKTGNGIYDRLQERGYEVIAINPHMQEYKGEPCYPNLKAVPGGVDAVVIAARPAIAEDVVKDCVATGVRHVWMHYNPMFGKGNSSVSPLAVTLCEDNGINVISCGCPLMFEPTADGIHKCMRWMLQVTGNIPKSA